MLLAIGVAVAAEHVRHFRPRPGHRPRGSEVLGRGRLRFDGRRVRQQVQGTRCGTDLAGGDPQVSGGGREATVTKQQLNGANVGAGLQQMDSECMPQTMGRDGLPSCSSCAASYARHDFRNRLLVVGSANVCNWAIAKCSLTWCHRIVGGGHRPLIIGRYEAQCGVFHVDQLLTSPIVAALQSRRGAARWRNQINLLSFQT
jgi:hypothetical protein